MRRLIGVNTWVWTSPLQDAELEPLLRKIAGMGFDSVELPVESPGDWDPVRAKELLDELSLLPIVVGAMGPGRSLLARAGDVEATQAYLRHCLAVAAIVGSPVVAGPFYAPTGTTWRMSAEERVDAAAELRASLAPLVAEAATAGLALAIEPLNRYETSVINTVEQGMAALEPLLGPGLGLALDSYHLNIEEQRPNDAIRAAGAAIAYVQVCGNDRGAVGGDHTDWPGMLDALDDAGYAGPLGVESFTGDNDTIAVAASVWRPLAPSQDGLAERSIAYLTALQDERARA